MPGVQGYRTPFPLTAWGRPRRTQVKPFGRVATRSSAGFGTRVSLALLARSTPSASRVSSLLNMVRQYADHEKYQRQELKTEIHARSRAGPKAMWLTPMRAAS
jgi:hypothetical protein